MSSASDAVDAAERTKTEARDVREIREVVVDASVWVSRYVPRDEHHRPSRRWLAARLEAGTIFAAPTLLPLEVASAIARRTGSAPHAERVAASLLSLPILRLVSLDVAFITEAVTVATSLRLRGADSLYVAVARQLGVPLVTWDAEQLARGSALVATYTPDTFPK